MFKGIAMLKKLGILTTVCFSLCGCYYIPGNGDYAENAPADAAYGETQTPYVYQQNDARQPRLKMPSSVVVCRSKQCAPAKLSMSKEYIYNSLLHMFDSNARQKALVCEADANNRTCTEQYVPIPVTIGVTPGFVYIDDVKITDVSFNEQNTMALNLVLNWGISDNGQTPVCRPSKTVVFAKNVNNVVLEDNGYDCKMTTIGTSTIKTLFAIDYIDLDYSYIGGFYSIGVSGPAYGGGNGYMLIRMPKEISLQPTDFQPIGQEDSMRATKRQQDAIKRAAAEGVTPNVDAVIKYNHPAAQYSKQKAEQAQKNNELSEHYRGVQVFPVNNAAAPGNKKQ